MGTGNLHQSVHQSEHLSVRNPQREDARHRRAAPHRPRPAERPVAGTTFPPPSPYADVSPAGLKCEEGDPGAHATGRTCVSLWAEGSCSPWGIGIADQEGCRLSLPFRHGHQPLARDMPIFIILLLVDSGVGLHRAIRALCWHRSGLRTLFPRGS